MDRENRRVLLTRDGTKRSICSNLYKVSVLVPVPRVSLFKLHSFLERDRASWAAYGAFKVFIMVLVQVK